MGYRYSMVTLSQEATIIAHRTRSKYPIDKPLEAIEASFVAPDAEIDMYDSYDPEDEDVEWKNWLASLYKTDGELMLSVISS